jgi:hypothetical protein
MAQSLAPTLPQVVKPKASSRPSPGAGLSRGVSVSHQEIQLRAYHKWEAMGKPAGKNLEIWLRAQHELMNAKLQALPITQMS